MTDNRETCKGYALSQSPFHSLKCRHCLSLELCKGTVSGHLKWSKFPPATWTHNALQLERSKPILRGIHRKWVTEGHVSHHTGKDIAITPSKKCGTVIFVQRFIIRRSFLYQFRYCRAQIYLKWPDSTMQHWSLISIIFGYFNNIPFSLMYHISSFIHSKSLSFGVWQYKILKSALAIFEGLKVKE